MPQEEISKEQIKERKTPKSNVLSNPSGGAAFAFVCVSLRLSLVFVDSGGTTTRNALIKMVFSGWSRHRLWPLGGVLNILV